MHIELNISFHCLQLYCISACSPCFIVDSYHNTKEFVHYCSLHTYLIVQFQYERLNSIQWETTLSTRVQWKYLGCLFSRLVNFTHLQSYLDHLCPLPLHPKSHSVIFFYVFCGKIRVSYQNLCSIRLSNVSIYWFDYVFLL